LDLRVQSKRPVLRQMRTVAKLKGPVIGMARDQWPTAHLRRTLLSSSTTPISPPAPRTISHVNLAISPARRPACRLAKAYHKHGPQALMSRRRAGQATAAIQRALCAEVIGTIRERYPNFGPTLAAEKLVELHGVHRGRETLRRAFADAISTASSRTRPRSAACSAILDAYLFFQRRSRAARHDKNSSKSFLRASAEVAGTCRRSARNRSNSAFECLAFIRRGRSAAFPLPTITIAKANPVRSCPTRLSATSTSPQ
jgi:hypothetical protein